MTSLDIETDPDPYLEERKRRINEHDGNQGIQKSFQKVLLCTSAASLGFLVL